MNQAIRSILSRPLDSFLLVLTIVSGMALSGLVLSAAWPMLGSDYSQPGLSAHEITVQDREDDWTQFYSPNAPPVARVGRVGEAKITMQEGDLDKLKAQAPDVKTAYLSQYAYLGDQSKGLQVTMVTGGYFDALNAEVTEGALPTAADYKSQRRVTVLTEYAARFLFPKSSAVGQSVQDFKVIGVIKVSPADASLFRSADQVELGSLGIVPYGSAGFQQGTMNIIQPPLSTLQFLPLPGRDALATEQLGRAARSMWGDRVSVTSSLQRNVAYSQVARRSALSLALLGVGGLLIASLGILALMLARVLARQRQLAMAAALGASRARLRGQYLAEIVLLGAAGSVLGTMSAAGLVWWLGQGITGPFAGVLRQQPLVLLGVAFGSLLLSVLFGLVPAVQASQVRPAEALRA